MVRTLRPLLKLKSNRTHGPSMTRPPSPPISNGNFHGKTATTPSPPEMSNPPSSSSSSQPTKNGLTTTSPHIPTEIVSDEEMAFIEAALAATRSSASSPLLPSLCSPSKTLVFQTNSRSVQSITALSKKRLEGCSGEAEIEDAVGARRKKNRTIESLMEMHRKRGLYVTDYTRAEWCEKQVEFNLRYGKKKTTEAMKAGKARHVKLEEEVVKKVKVAVKSREDSWALRFFSFITGANQLIFEGLTREIPLIGLIDGIWMFGIADEIRMSGGNDNSNPIIIDTKTRERDTLPGEPQRRNGRFQLMCYKLLWDNSVDEKFPFAKFLDFFSLDPNHILFEDIREHIAGAGIQAKTLDDVLKCYVNTCSMLSPANNKMILRYESQNDNSLLGEDEFPYDSDWLKSQIKTCLEFWRGEREARCTPEEERWKCRSCQYASVCPAYVTVSPKKTGNQS